MWRHADWVMSINLPGPTQLVNDIDSSCPSVQSLCSSHHTIPLSVLQAVYLELRALCHSKIHFVLAPGSLSASQKKANVVVSSKFPKQLHSFIFGRMYNQSYRVSWSKPNKTKHKHILCFSLQQMASIISFTHLVIPFFLTSIYEMSIVCPVSH